MDMKQLRQRANKRAEDIAVELGVAISTVRNWEQYKTSPRMTPLGLQRLMKIYGCTFDELVQAEVEREQKESLG
jgi:transcriptional regulator with XRE-family HTH domain